MPLGKETTPAPKALYQSQVVDEGDSGFTSSDPLTSYLQFARVFQIGMSLPREGNFYRAYARTMRALPEVPGN